MRPKELVELLGGKIRGGGLGRSGDEPTGAIHESGNKSQTRASLRGGLREGESRLSKQ